MRYYIQQFGCFWRVTEAQFLRFIREGEGGYDLGQFGKQLRRRPSDIKVCDDGERCWYEAVRSGVTIIGPLDWKEQEWADARETFLEAVAV
jgi:hypothetical protein